jgi:hypothetical protein
MAALNVMGMNPNDYIAVAKQEDGSFVVFKGDGADGPKVTGYRGSLISRSKQGAISFSARVLWEEMEGNTDTSSVYTVSAEQSSEVEGIEGLIAYTLQFKETRDKQVNDEEEEEELDEVLPDQDQN